MWLVNHRNNIKHHEAGGQSRNREMRRAEKSRDSKPMFEHDNDNTHAYHIGRRTFCFLCSSRSEEALFWAATAFAFSFHGSFPFPDIYDNKNKRKNEEREGIRAKSTSTFHVELNSSSTLPQLFLNSSSTLPQLSKFQNFDENVTIRRLIALKTN